MIVVDASVLVPALVDVGEDGTAARLRLTKASRVVAPDLVDVEVASVLRRRALAYDLSDRQLDAAVDDLSRAPIDRVPMRALIGRALELRANVTTYDGVYVALAEALGCVLLTADRRLASAPGVRCATELLTRG